MPLALNTPEAPLCPYCGQPAVLRSGAEVYRFRDDLADKWFWCCDPCQSRCGCHGKTKKPLGVPARADLRDARMKLHDQMLDPLWKNAVAAGGYEPEDEKARAIIVSTARRRVYAFLADRMGLTKDETHTALFSLEQCRQAWRALRGVTYAQIREWAKARKAAEIEKDAA